MDTCIFCGTEIDGYCTECAETASEMGLDLDELMDMF